jgi:exopolyphosphatase/guanosine-5'-triphosphate,3'-diphosphate pyrophosphatase
LLSDTGWSAHPDYRAEHAFTHALRMPAPALDHHGRVFLAVALHARYGGDSEDPMVDHVRGLLDDANYMRARAIGSAFRLAYTVTGGAPSLLGDTSLLLDGGALVLSIPSHDAIYAGEAVQRRLDTLGRLIGRRTEVRRER